MPSQDGYVIAFTECFAEHAMLRNLFLILLLVAVAALTGAFLISLFSAKRSIRPVEESFNRQKQFVADASHELKTPLTTINTNVDVLLSHQDSRIGDERKWLDYIKTETERMTKLTNDLLYLAKLDHDDNNIMFSKVSFSEAAESIILVMEAVLFEKDINLTYNITPNVYVNGSSEQLKQVVMILFDNAVKYTPKSGNISISLTAETGDAVLRVRNSGEGISEDAQKHIFDRFYREDKSRARESGGYGLGLAIAKAAVTSCKGTIRVNSEKNTYTEFTVKIPISK
jgi:signal transduction histidine kinase